MGDCVILTRTNRNLMTNCKRTQISQSVITSVESINIHFCLQLTSLTCFQEPSSTGHKPPRSLHPAGPSWTQHTPLTPAPGSRSRHERSRPCQLPDARGNIEPTRRRSGDELTSHLARVGRRRPRRRRRTATVAPQADEW